MSEIADKSESYIVTMKDGTKPLLFEENIYNQLAKKHNKPSVLSSQADREKEKVAEYKEPKYDLTMLCEMLEINTWHRRAVQIVAGDAKGNNWKLVPKSNLGREPSQEQKAIAEEYIDNLPVNIHDLFYEITYDLRSMGINAVELVEDDNDMPTAIYPMDPADIRLHKNNCIVKQTVGTKTRYFQILGRNYDTSIGWYDVDKYNGSIHPEGTLPRERRANKVIITREYASHTRSYGLANITSAFNAIYGELGRMTYNNKFFENYGVPAFAVTVTGDFKDEKKTLKNGKPNPKYRYENTLRYHIEQGLKELAENPHSALVITVPSISEDSNVDVKITQLSTTEKEGSFIQYRRDNREEIAVAHGVPLDRFGVAITGALGGNVVEGLGDVYSDTVLPTIIHGNENIINSQLPLLGVLDWEFQLDDFRKKDEQKELTIGTELLTHGALTLGQYINRFATNYGGKMEPDHPLYNLRLFNNNIIDEYGNILGQDPIGNEFLEDLENELLTEAETIENQDGESSENINGINSTNGTESTYGIENTANKHNTNSITETIQRMFNLRK